MNDFTIQHFYFRHIENTYADVDLSDCPEDHPYCRVLTDTKTLCTDPWMKRHCCQHCKRSEFFLGKLD